ncbi:MAG TPA: hypothetical protein VH054_00025 [Polyangiaceae bacterium]|jgi:hypothetical protein|nr:hypothetical protein [Polyangiaceae bacterium]
MRVRSLVALALVLTSAAISIATDADAQVRRRVVMSNDDDDDDDESQPQVVDDSQPSPLRSRFGSDHAEIMLRSSDSEQVRRGIMRAAAANTTESTALLVAQADTSNNDELTLIELARALAPHAKEDAPRARLITMLNASAHISRTRGSTALTTAMTMARVELARQIAARALVASRDPKALDAVFAAARESGQGQQNALRALASDPRAEAEAPLTPPTSAAGARALAQTGDLRALDALLVKAQGPFDATTRSACLLALGQLGDGRARAIAIASFADQDAHVRAAAGETLVLLDAPERYHAVVQLLSSPDTAAAAVRLAHRAQDVDVVKALAAKLAATNDLELRLAIIAALGRGIANGEGLKVLASIAADPRLGGDAVQSIARSPNTAALGTLERIAQGPAKNLRRLAVRGYVLRALLRGEHSGSLESAIDGLRASSDATDHALGAFARVALGHANASEYLDDRDPAVRRAAAMGTLASYDGRTLSSADELLSRLSRETDDATRSVLAIGLIGGDPRALVPTLTLVQRVEAGGADAPLSAAALAARKGDSLKDRIDTLAASNDPIMRAHVARGLGASEEPSATGRLAELARYEAEPLVRLAQTTALARRGTAPSRNEILSISARFDPEARIRDIATRALASATPPAVWPVREVAWLRVTTADGAAPVSTMLASYVTAEGVAIPIAFDADGYALVAGIPPGDGRLVLAPVVPAK